MDSGGTAALVLLDPTASFDTVDHSILIDRLQNVGIRNKALALLKSFLADREQTVTLDSFVSKPFALPCRIPQGSSLSPTLFILYVTELASLIMSFGLSLTSYADDTQIVVSALNNIHMIGAHFHDCMCAINQWMSSHCLKLNFGKADVTVFGNNPQLWSPSIWPHEMAEHPAPVIKAKNLGAVIDNKLNYATQIYCDFILLQHLKSY